MSWTRRQLVLGAGSAALLAGLGLGGVALQRTRLRDPVRPLQALDPVSFSILAAVVDTLCPGGAGLPAPAELGIAEDVDVFLSTCDPSVVEEVVLALTVVENAAVSLLLDQHLRRPFSACDGPTRLAVLHAFRDSGLPLRRTIYKALLKISASTYWGHPATYAHGGYVPRSYGARP